MMDALLQLGYIYLFKVKDKCFVQVHFFSFSHRYYSHPSLSRHRKGPGNNVEIERDKENVEIRRDFSYITIM